MAGIGLPGLLVDPLHDVLVGLRRLPRERQPARSLLDEKRPERRIALQEYGKSNTALIEGLRAQNRAVSTVRIYSWGLPEDTALLREAAAKLARPKSPRGIDYQRSGSFTPWDRSGTGENTGSLNCWRAVIDRVSPEHLNTISAALLFRQSVAECSGIRSIKRRTLPFAKQ